MWLDFSMSKKDKDRPIGHSTQGFFCFIGNMTGDRGRSLWCFKHRNDIISPRSSLYPMAAAQRLNVGPRQE